MSTVCHLVDLSQVPAVPWAWVDERTYAAIRGCSVKTLQNERRLNIGCPFKRVNGTSIRYRLGDITEFLESQPGGGGAGRDAGRGTGHGAGHEAAPQTNQRRRGAGRPRRSLT